MENLKKIKEVNVVEEYIAIIDCIKALGYETENITIGEVSSIKRDILKVIKGIE